MITVRFLLLITTLIYVFELVSSQCGNPTFKPVVASRIVNGQIAVPNSFPWMVSFRQRILSIYVSNHFCGGSLISNRHIVTAAHCVNRFTPSQILAFVNVKNISDVATSTPLLVESITFHPLFNISSAGKGFDIAV